MICKPSIKLHAPKRFSLRIMLARSLREVTISERWIVAVAEPSQPQLLVKIELS